MLQQAGAEFCRKIIQKTNFKMHAFSTPVFIGHQRKVFVFEFEREFNLEHGLFKMHRRFISRVNANSFCCCRFPKFLRQHFDVAGVNRVV